MKRWGGCLALLVSFGLAASLSAEEPHLEFVRALRARQYTDLAMEYLQKISEKPSPELARELPLEFARTRLDLAKQEPDLGRRVGLYAQARRDLEATLKNNPAQEGEARLEIAQVTVLQAKAQLSRAEREETKTARRAELAKARPLLEDAAKQLEAASARIDTQLEKVGEPKTAKEQAEKRALELAKLRADYDRGLNLLDQATTYTEENLKILEKRTQLAEQAEKTLRKVAAVDPKNPLCWQAEAWVGKCLQESGNPKGARTRFENILKAPEAADAGKRLAAYFLIHVLPETAGLQEKPIELQKQAAEQWLIRWRPYLNTPEGQGVLFKLGEIYFYQAEELKDPKAKTPLYDRAKEYYRQLEMTDNDYTERARDRKIYITFKAQGGPVGDVTKFTTFDDCYVRAQYEAFKLNTEDPKEIKDPKELEKKRKERFRTMITALSRGLKLAETAKVKVPERDLLTASSMLAYAYMEAEDYANAVKSAETIVYGKTQSGQASGAAVYALEAYMQLVTDPAADPAMLEDYRKGLSKLVSFVKERWADEPVADYARHQLGLQLARDKKFAESVAELSAIRPTYPNIIQVKWQIAGAANQAEQDKIEPTGPDKRPFREQAMAALESMPDLPGNADPLTTHIFVSAKLQIGNQLFQQKKFKEMESLAQPLLERLPKMNVADDKTRDELRTGLNALVLYSRYGQAEAEYAAGKYADVCKVLDPVVENAKGGKSPELKAIPDLRWALLGLALRANVMENNMKRAQDVLQVLQSYTGEKEGAVKIEAILQPIVLMMSKQIEELRSKDQQAQLDKTVKSFSAFLDLLKGQQKNPSQEFLFVMGQSYIGLGKYADAVKMFEEVKEPPEGDEKAQRLYRAARLLLIKALRESKQLDKADESLKAVMGSWGKQNLEALKEEGHMLDARALPGQAATHWTGLLKTLQGRVTTDANAKEQYFEIYFYRVRSLYRFGVQQTDAAKKDKYIKAAGGAIVNLENAWPDLGGEASKARFDELRRKEAALNKAYEQAKAENK